MALRVPAPMALLLSLMSVAHCAAVPLDESGLAATNASSSAAVTAVPDGEEGLLRLPSGKDSVVVAGKVEEAVTKPVAEPDPDRSLPSSNDDDSVVPEEAVAEPDPDRSRPSSGDDSDDEEEEKERKKRKKQHGSDGKGKEKNEED
ncbi:unnamed protein product [Urochloa humidicola]